MRDVSVNLIVEEAGVAKGTFYVHFPARADYLVALHQQFHDRLLADVSAAIAGVENGRDKLVRGTTAYLDACIGSKGVKAFLLEARTEPAIQRQIQATNVSYSKMFSNAFEDKGWPHPETAMRLFVAMSAEVALIELELGKRSRKARESLWRFI